MILYTIKELKVSDYDNDYDDEDVLQDDLNVLLIKMPRMFCGMT